MKRELTAKEKLLEGYRSLYKQAAGQAQVLVDSWSEGGFRVIDSETFEEKIISPRELKTIVDKRIAGWKKTSEELEKAAIEEEEPLEADKIFYKGV